MTRSLETALQRFDDHDYVDDAEADDDTGFGEEGDADQQRALARLDDVADQARDYARHAKAPNTLRPTVSTGPTSAPGAVCIGWSHCQPRRRRSRCT